MTSAELILANGCEKRFEVRTRSSCIHGTSFWNHKKKWKKRKQREPVRKKGKIWLELDSRLELDSWYGITTFYCWKEWLVSYLFFHDLWNNSLSLFFPIRPFLELWESIFFVVKRNHFRLVYIAVYFNLISFSRELVTRH